MTTRSHNYLFHMERSSKTNSVLSKFLLGWFTKFKVNGNGCRLSGLSGASSPNRDLSTRLARIGDYPALRFQTKWSKVNPQYVRGLRTGSKPPNKTPRNFVLPQLDDIGTRMPGVVDLIVKPAIFTTIVTTGSFIGATIWQYENHRTRITTNNGRFPLPKWIIDEENGWKNREKNRADNRIHLWWKKASHAERIFWPICAVNAVVFTAWRIPGLTSKMITYFTCTPASRAICWPMVLSIFSHHSILHLGANMFVLHSFLPAATSLMGPEQVVGAYISAGVLSSFASHLHKILTGNMIPSLGASGAIMGILAYVCRKLPDIQLGIIFVPGFTFTADTAIKCVLAVDTVGLLAGWKILDHAAHLSGAMYGIGLTFFEDQVLKARDSIIRVWHTIRTS